MKLKYNNLDLFAFLYIKMLKKDKNLFNKFKKAW